MKTEYKVKINTTRAWCSTATTKWVKFKYAHIDHCCYAIYCTARCCCCRWWWWWLLLNWSSCTFLHYKKKCDHLKKYCALVHCLQSGRWWSTFRFFIILQHVAAVCIPYYCMTLPIGGARVRDKVHIIRHKLISCCAFKVSFVIRWW